VSDDVQVVEPVEQAVLSPAPAGRRRVLSLLRSALLERRDTSVLIVALAMVAYFE